MKWSLMTTKKIPLVTAAVLLFETRSNPAPDPFPVRLCLELVLCSYYIPDGYCYRQDGL